MSAYKVAEIWCDGCGERYLTDGEPTIPELRAEAKEHGWQRVKVGKMEDRCPDCTTCVVVTLAPGDLRPLPNIRAAPLGPEDGGT